MIINFKGTFSFLALPLAGGLIYFAMDWRSPELAAYRGLAGESFVVLTLLFIIGQAIAIHGARDKTATCIHVLKAGIALSSIGLLIFLASELQFQWQRHRVLTADAETLSRLGRHFVVGYRSPLFAEELISRNAVAGLFVTAHNVRGLDSVSIHATIEHFQLLHRANGGGKPLWIATDQEGGGVSRMSPPLEMQPSLGELAKKYTSEYALEDAVHAYGRKQGTALTALGFNLNFSPVVDVNYNIINHDDRYTRIYQRAISSDPYQVARVAGWYCDALIESGVRCTLKHFPGLGQVQADTHLESAKLTRPPQELTASDWVPFRSLMKAIPPPFTMLSHVQLDAIDPMHPVSTSRKVIDDLLRNEWRHEGVLITDDFSMAVITHRQGGIGAATVDALNAGVDLILISFDPEQYYPAMYALLEADSNGKLDSVILQKSHYRLSEIAPP